MRHIGKKIALNAILAIVRQLRIAQALGLLDTEKLLENTNCTALSVWSPSCRIAREDGYADSDNAWRTKLKPIINTENRRDCYLDIDQSRRLILNAPTDLAALLKVMSLIPLRPGAVAALTVGYFDKRLGVLTIGKDKSGSYRKITMPSSRAAFLTAKINGKLMMSIW